MPEPSGFQKEPKRRSLRRDSSRAARAKRDNLRVRRSAAKKRTKARRSSKH